MGCAGAVFAVGGVVVAAPPGGWGAVYEIRELDAVS